MSEKQTHTRETNDLIVLCQKGNQIAIEKLYRSYNKAMYHVCLRMLNNTQEAEDVLQESFISAFKNIHSYSKQSTFGAWLKRIVINKSIDVLRKRHLNFSTLEEEEVLDEVFEENEETIYDVEGIKKAMSDLPDGYRLILSLYVFEDYTHQEIAEKLGIKEGTSKSQYARAKKKLAQLILANHRTHER